MFVDRKADKEDVQTCAHAYKQLTIIWPPHKRRKSRHLVDEHRKHDM